MGSPSANQHRPNHVQSAQHGAAHHPGRANHRIHAAQGQGHTPTNHTAVHQTGHAVVNVNPGATTAVFTRPRSPTRAVRNPENQCQPEYAEILDDAVYTAEQQLPVMYTTPIPTQDGAYEEPVPVNGVYVSDPTTDPNTNTFYEDVGGPSPNKIIDDYEELTTGYTKLRLK